MSEPFEDEEEGGRRADEDAAVAIPLPRENPDLVGQEPAEAALLAAYRSGRLPHAWLLTGPRGIGKATLAFRFARFLLAQGSEAGGLFATPPVSLALDVNHPVFRRVASGGHADLLVIERGYDEKRKRRRSEIVVDDVRAIAEFLHLTSAEGGWRIVIIDGADEMNRNAANALLKVLEEPSERALLLISSASAGRLLPTIRSRCRRLAMKPINDPHVAEIIRKYAKALTPDEVGILVRLAAGSPGRALELAAAGGLDLYRELEGLTETLPGLDAVALDGFAENLGRFGGEDRFRLAAELLPAWVARRVLAAPGQAGVDHWIELWEKLNRLFNLVDAVNLDRKQAVLNAFFALEDASR